MDTPDALRKEAQRYRRLAKGISDPEVVKILEDAARDFERRVAEIENDPKRRR